MELILKPTDNQQGTLSGAFIRGAFPADWIREIASWEMDAAGMTCYVISESMQSIRPHGLFVVFRAGKVPELSRVRAPYQLRAGKLFLPFGSVLSPQVETDELKTLLFWDAYIFHPAVGLLGFEKSDAIDLKYLLHLPEPGTTNWGFAHEGFPSPPRLSEIEITGTSPEALLDELKKEIEQKPLSDLTKENPKTVGEKLKSQVSRGLLKTGLKAVDATKGARGFAEGLVIFPFAVLGAIFGGGRTVVTGGGSGNSINYIPANNKPGLMSNFLSLTGNFFDKLFGRNRPVTFVPGNASHTPSNHAQPPRKARKPFNFRFIMLLENWMKRNLDNIEKKREEELKRLMRMFEENPDEALKYALPLDSPYLKRGNAPPSDQLSKRDTNFDMNRIGGGGAVDSWNTGDYHAKLRELYQKAAEREIQAGRFKKAAYIYAELLNDFTSAANVLIQGKFFREAAALYIKHLNNKPAAAECLEKGGLYLEAIKLYTELGKHEKAGDLYRELELNEEAEVCYIVCFDIAMQAANYIEASRLTLEKLGNPEKARRLLLEGWNKSNQPETCLQKYFSSYEPTEAQPLAREIQMVYDKHTPAARQQMLLNVLTAVLRTNKDEETETTARQIAYEVISAEAEKGVLGNLHKLENFVKDDRLVGSDSSRYALNQKNYKPKIQLAANQFQLDQSVHWLTARNYRNQFLAIGKKENGLLLARGNWSGAPEYTFCAGHPNAVTRAFITADPRFTTRVLLYTDSDSGGINPAALPATTQFDTQLQLENPTWLPKHLMGLGISSSNTILTVSCPGGYYTLSYFTENGTLLKSRDCTLNGEAMKRLVNRPVSGAELIFRKEKYYFFEFDELFSMDESGAVNVYTIPKAILCMSCTPNYSALRIVLATNGGALIINPDHYNPEEPPVFFAEGFIARSVQYIGEQYVVLAGNREARIYDVSGKPTHIRSITTDSTICSILLTPRQHHFAILEQNGRMLVHHISS